MSSGNANVLLGIAQTAILDSGAAVQKIRGLIRLKYILLVRTNYRVHPEVCIDSSW